MLTSIIANLKAVNGKFLVMWEIASETARTTPVGLTAFDKLKLKAKVMLLLCKTAATIRKEQRLKAKLDIYLSHLAASNIFLGSPESNEEEDETIIPALELDPTFVSPPQNYEN
ncbi:hypothetical protein DRO91_05670 [Candidatus Heimdallarchaeota archaeon]|nr:MAG: hypothetical protein DRO91_05670 [Candidatus Heimdallarchaeota archaeon]